MNNSPDYTKYSLSDLYEAQASIDKDVYPERHEIINKQIEIRQTEEQIQKEKIHIKEDSINPDKIIRLIGGYEIFNGIIGIIFLLVGLIISLPEFEWKYTISIASSLIMYILLCFAGIKLIKFKIIGFIFSIALLSIQTILIKIFGFVFYFSSLIKFMAIYNYSSNWSNFDINFGLGFSSIGISFNLPGEEFALGINIFCIILIGLLISQKKKFKK